MTPAAVAMPALDVAATYDVVLRDETACPPLLRRPPASARPDGELPVFLVVRREGGLDVCIVGHDDPALEGTWEGMAARAVPGPPVVSVIVASVGRDSLRDTIASLLAQDVAIELIVVDNRPALGLARAIAAEWGHPVTLVSEPRSGASSARNAGVAAATCDLVAFIDDDVTVEADWARRLAAAFASPEVGLVTGIVLPAELATPHQVLFEAYGGFARGLQSRMIAAEQPSDPLHPWNVGRIGASNAMAVRRRVFLAAGGLAPHLGVGTASRGGEDLLLLHRVLRAGWSVGYTVEAIAWHRHRRSGDELDRQIFAYGTGLAAYLLEALRAPGATRDLLRRTRPALRHFLSPSSTKNEARGVAYPKRLTLLELAGVAAGPVLYVRARRAARDD